MCVTLQGMKWDGFWNTGSENLKGHGARLAQSFPGDDGHEQLKEKSTDETVETLTMICSTRTELQRDGTGPSR